MTRDEAIAELTAPGGPFAVTTASVNGWPDIRVYEDRLGSMRDLFATGLGHGDRPYMTQGGRTWSFTEFATDVNRLSRALTEDFGVGPGDRVAILAANCVPWALTFWATVNVGAIATALNGWWKPDEVRHALELTEPTVLLVDGPRHEDLPASVAAGAVIPVGESFDALVAGDDPGPPEVPIAEDDAAVIFFTSGTTGRAKGVLSTHRGMVANLQNVFLTGTAMLMAAGDDVLMGGDTGPPVSLLTSPMFHVSGGHSGMVLGWTTGQHHVLLEGRVTAEKVMAAIEEHRITFWPSVPTLVWRVCHHPDRGRYDLSSITRVAFGGAPASPELHERARATFPNLTDNVGTGWGLTETTSAVTANTGPDYVARPTSVGKPFPIVELKVVDEDGREVPTGTDGEVLVRGCQVTPGYWNDPEATATAIDAEGWFRTGDVGHVDADGFLFLTDRKKDVILRGGENVYCTEIEHRLLEHAAVADAAVIGVPHDELGEEVKAVVQVVAGADPSPRALAAWVAETLADFKVPSQWELREHPLPRNASGKLLKQELRGPRTPS